ncbi:hypothetical protein OIU84_025918 [Salix udensis]|uniref:Uncharacterized protein n=1 Tax=Salix udensis TaxID=889485 RepID=A0AAD6KLX5_9ROSI|nr:hypothetical protein OIU84_025918 [Salix udensis]
MGCCRLGDDFVMGFLCVVVVVVVRKLICCNANGLVVEVFV